MKIKTRRLIAEIAAITEQLADAKSELKYNPYRQDHPAIKRRIKELTENLADAEGDLAGEKKGN